MPRGTEFAKSVWKTVVANKNFGQCLKNVELISAGQGKCKAQFTVNEDHLNIAGGMHGGFTSTIIDCISTYALMTNTDDSVPGVSVDLHVTFMKPALLGDKVTVDAKTVRAGKNLAFLTVELTKNDGKDVIALGNHTKESSKRFVFN